MRKEIPAGVLEMLSVPGLRPDKVLKLYQTLGISSLAELEETVRADRLKGIKGLGPGLQANQEYRNRPQRRRPPAHASGGDVAGKCRKRAAPGSPGAEAHHDWRRLAARL
jgi:hypothetical protein